MIVNKIWRLTKESRIISHCLPINECSMRVFPALLTCLLISLWGCSSTKTTNFQGETSEVSLDEVFSAEDKTGPTGAAASASSTSSISDLPGIDQQSFQDYDAFKSWLRAREPNNPEFYEFQLWREYLEYLRLHSLN